MAAEAIEAPKPRPGGVLISRTEAFSAAHRLHAASLTDEENKKIFGKCNNPNGHGHNYKVTVTVYGVVDPITGMVINLVDLGTAMKDVLGELDHKHIDKDVDFFRSTSTVSTVENITIFIWKQLAEHTSLVGAHLYDVTVHETDKNVASYRGPLFTPIM
ncbi:6-pyruvoyl tetrahydrobiopterin synthase-like [Sycon ciliatum]|uniref:6-pyruvoyl tetrahydrobiopterin synthase-like n=1 Tax=Sycon ciliatum TaxID=27933 RepID=UPI0031F654F1